MASSFNRKSSSSASSASKPTFRRASGQASSGRRSAPVQPKKKTSRQASSLQPRKPARAAVSAKPAKKPASRPASALQPKKKPASRSASALQPKSVPARRSAASGGAPSSARGGKGHAPTMARRPQDKAVGGKRKLVPPVQRAGATPGRATSRPGAAGGKRPLSLPRIPLPHIPAIKLPAFAGRVAGIAAAALIAVAVLGIVVANSPIFAITDVVVNGSEHVTQQTAEQLVNVPDGATLMNVDTGAIEEALSQNPWVSGATIERQFPHTLVITPAEHEVAAIAFIASSDVAWSISAEGTWIAPISLSVIMDAEGNVESTSSLAQADMGAQSDASAQGDASADGSGADADGAAGDGSADAGTADADAAGASADASASTAPAVPEGSQLLTGLDAAVALAQQDGAVLFTDVAADIEPSSGAEVTSEVLLAGLEYVNGFSAEFRSQVREMSLGSVEAISAILTSGVEVSLGEPTDISTKERIVTRLLEQEQGVVYINVSTPDQYTFRQA